MDKVVVYGFDGSGPAALQFAARHPNRTNALLTESAVTGKFKHQLSDAINSSAMKFISTSTLMQRMTSWMSGEALVM